VSDPAVSTIGRFAVVIDTMASGHPIKLTVVGDGTVGKTCMLVVYTNQTFPKDYVPTVFDNYADTLVVDGCTYNLTLWDTAGQEDYERLRPISYPGTNVFLCCYAVDSVTSFKHIESKWIPELRHYCANTPIVLVATKIDLRSEKSTCITTAAGLKMSKKIRAAKFVECSSLTNVNITEVFHEAVRATQDPVKATKRCIFL